MGSPRSGLRRFRFFAALLGLAGALLFRGHEAALAADPYWTVWTVAEVAGDATVQPGDDFSRPAEPLQLGQLLPDDSIVATGPSGRAVLRKGGDIVRLDANSTIQLPAPERGGIWTRVVQSAGKVFFKVETRPARHFEVDTPFMTALVKGTEFSIGIETGDAQLEVTHGVVGVSREAGGRSVDVTAGQRAKANRERKEVEVANAATEASESSVQSAVARSASTAAADDDKTSEKANTAEKSAGNATEKVKEREKPAGERVGSREGWKGGWWERFREWRQRHRNHHHHHRF